ncbi:MAG TPA: thiamine phosphate synthase [Kofleriaceae bacterium]|nr:thiamine phosphate synthase [Kofleriaceae bacterium]
MDWRDKLRGFYAVLDRDDRMLAEDLLAAARVLQVRLKGAPRGDLLRVAGWARELTAARGALLVVNDDLEAALAVGADAVHLGQDDLPLADARAEIARRGASLLVGVSTHDLEQVRRAAAGGADYLGFGPVFGTTTKERPDPTVGVELLREAVRAAAPIPVVAIGGITPGRAAEVAAAGAHAACAIAAVNRAADIAAAGRAIAAALA